jgi:leucyl-tRNA synthetase
VIKKDLEQWFFKTTDYAEELLDFSHMDWPERVELLQKNWIGKSEGAEVNFPVFVERDSALNLVDPGHSSVIRVFTTRPDTLWGATFMVLAPEHPLVERITTREQKEAVTAYVLQTLRQSEIQREATDKEKTGVFTGGYALNPVNGERIPIWIADYVLMTYGTGAIMAVPAHDERDFAFALKFGLPILPVIERPDGLTRSFARTGMVRDGFVEALTSAAIPYEMRTEGLFITIPEQRVDEYVELAGRQVQPGGWIEVVGTRWLFIFSDEIVEWDSLDAGARILERCLKRNAELQGVRTVMEMLWAIDFYRDVLYHHEYGRMIHSGEFTGTPGDVAVREVTSWLEEHGAGKAAVNYRLRDWLISRQRYWGAPIPIVYCPDHGAVPVPDSELPVLLPDDVEWLPTGESPLKLHPTWKQAVCPECGKPAVRETDTMDTFMCSSWYHLRYLSPRYARGPFDPAEYRYWMPVDTYTGGIEHATLHLIYTRFFHKACRDMGITTGPEPMTQLRNQGIILGEDSEKMSKSRGNVEAPDELVRRYGADTIRAYLMFFARWDQGGPWNSGGIEGTARWLKRVWAMFVEEPRKPKVENQEKNQELITHIRELRRKLHQTLRQVTHDFESFEFNTIVSALMELLNEMNRAKERGVEGMDAWVEATDIYLRMLAPVAPHIAEELWARLGKPYSVHQQPWPEVDEEAAFEEQITLVVQVNGKLRDRITVPVDIGEEEAKALALESEAVQKYLDGKPPRKVIVVPGKLVNIVV